MIEDIMSLNAQVGIGSIFRQKIRMILVLVSFFIINIFSAQEIVEQKTNTTEPIISVVGNAVIYSRDAAFNQQVQNNKYLKLNSKVETGTNSELKISTKNKAKKNKIVSSHHKPKESIVVVAKEELEKKYTTEIPSKDEEIKIENKDIPFGFSSGFSQCHVSCLPPNNDLSVSKFFIGYHSFQERISAKFANNINYYYKNRNLKQQKSIYKLSVRPPPFLLS